MASSSTPLGRVTGNTSSPLSRLLLDDMENFEPSPEDLTDAQFPNMRLGAAVKQWRTHAARPRRTHAACPPQLLSDIANRIDESVERVATLAKSTSAAASPREVLSPSQIVDRIDHSVERVAVLAKSPPRAPTSMPRERLSLRQLERQIADRVDSVAAVAGVLPTVEAFAGHRALCRGWNALNANCAAQLRRKVLEEAASRCAPVSAARRAALLLVDWRAAAVASAVRHTGWRLLASASLERWRLGAAHRALAVAELATSEVEAAGHEHDCRLRLALRRLQAHALASAQRAAFDQAVWRSTLLAACARWRDATQRAQAAAEAGVRTVLRARQRAVAAAVWAWGARAARAVSLARRSALPARAAQLARSRVAVGSWRAWVTARDTRRGAAVRTSACARRRALAFALAIWHVRAAAGRIDAFTLTAGAAASFARLAARFWSGLLAAAEAHAALVACRARRSRAGLLTWRRGAVAATTRGNAPPRRLPRQRLPRSGWLLLLMWQRR